MECAHPLGSEGRPQSKGRASVGVQTEHTCEDQEPRVKVMQQWHYQYQAKARVLMGVKGWEDQAEITHGKNTGVLGTHGKVHTTTQFMFNCLYHVNIFICFNPGFECMPYLCRQQKP